jgi:phage terminase large subunit GpA-like protein
MDEGAILAWPDKPVAAGYLSALQELMSAYLDDPDKFMSEHQQEPIAADAGSRRFDPAAASRKVNGRSRCEIPPTCPFVVAYIDTHDKALYWLVTAFEQNFTPYVIDYGTWPEQPGREFTLANLQRPLSRHYPKHTTRAAVYAGMEELVSTLLARRYQKGSHSTALDVVLADTGYLAELWQQLKTKFDRLTLTKGVGIKAGSRPMAEWLRRPGEVTGDHWIRSPAARREHPVTQIDTNHWKTIAMDAVAAAPGEPGALTIFGDTRTVHAQLAAHWDAELSVETEGFGRKVTEWKQKPNRDNHWLDCTVGCFVGASILGARPEGSPIVPQKGRVRRHITQQDLMQRKAFNARAT